MAWSEAARKAAALARKLHAKEQSSGPFRAVLYRAGPTNNPTGSGVRFGTKTSAKTYGMLYRAPVKRYMVRLKNPLHIEGDIFSAAKKLGVSGVTLAGYERAQRQLKNSEYWMRADKRVHDAAVKKGYTGLVMKSTDNWTRTYHSAEVVAFNKRGAFRELSRKK